MSEQKRPWLHALFTVILLVGGFLLEISNTVETGPMPAADIAAALALGNEETPLRLRGRIEAINPETPPDLKEPNPAAFYQVRLHRCWVEQRYEKKVTQERLEKSWDHKSSMRLRDESGSILIDAREAFWPEHGVVRPLRVFEKYAAASDGRLRIGRIDWLAEPENEDEYWTLERLWLPVGAEVEATGVVIKGPNGPELSGPKGGLLRLEAVGAEPADDNEGTSPLLAYAALGLGALSLIALIARWLRRAPAE